MTHALLAHSALIRFKSLQCAVQTLVALLTQAQQLIYFKWFSMSAA